MANIKLKEKAIKVICNNCFQQITGFRNETGLIKYQCPKCGSITVSRVVGRRHIQLDMYAPQGQEIIEEDT